MEYSAFPNLPCLILQEIAALLIIDDILNLSTIFPSIAYLVNYCRGGLSLAYSDLDSTKTHQISITGKHKKYRALMELAYEPILILDVYKYICISGDTKLCDILIQRRAFTVLAPTLPQSARLLMKYCMSYTILALTTNKGDILEYIYQIFGLKNTDMMILWKNIKNIDLQITNIYHNVYTSRKISIENILYKMVTKYGLRICYVPKDQRKYIMHWIDEITSTPYYSSKVTELQRLLLN